MRRYHVGIAVAAMLVAAAQAAEASPIVTAGAPGVFSPSDAGATVLTFDSLPIGALTSYAFTGGSLNGNGGIENTTTGTYAAPAGDATNYLTVSLDAASGRTVLTLTAQANYFGLFWGSMDSYNSIVFLMNGVVVAQFSGTNIAALTGLTANGNQGSSAANRYINFNFGSTFYDEVELISTNYAFEVDDIAFGDPLPVPEPASLALFLAGLASLALVRHENAAAPRS
jgi:hypothetical protein